MASGEDDGGPERGRTDEEDGTDRLRASRRLYLKVGGIVALTGAGVVGKWSDGRDERPRRMAVRYGYGGAPILSSQLQAATAVTESEPNDDRHSATVIPPDTHVDGTLSGAEVDWYGVEAREADDLAIEFIREEGSGVTAVVLYDPDGNFLDQVYVGSDAAVELRETASADATYFVQVVNVEEGDGGYRLTVWTGGEESPSTPTSTATPAPTTTATPTATETSTTEPTTTVPGTTTIEPTATPTPAPEDGYGARSYGELGYGGVSYYGTQRYGEFGYGG